MERAKSIRFHWPMILLCLFIFLCAVFIPIDSARCERDIGSIEIYSKYPDGPVVVPEMDFGEPGSDPHLGPIALPDPDNEDASKEEKYSEFEAMVKLKKWNFMFFMQFMLNQISCSR